MHVVASPDAGFQPYVAAPGVHGHSIAMRRESSPLHDVVALGRWVRMLRAIRPLLVSVGTPKAALLGIVAARLTRVPVRVYVVRGLRFQTTTGMRRRLLIATEWVTCSLATHVCPVSRSLAAVMTCRRLVPSKKIHVIGRGSSNGVKIEEERHVPLRNPSAGDVTIGYVGRVTVDKGLLTLCEAIEILAKAHPEAVVRRLRLIGADEEGLSEQIVRRVRAAGWQCDALGQMAVTAATYQTFDLLVLPTYREGFPNVVLEAAVAGVPTVTTNATGAVDSVLQDQTGLIVPVGNAAALADALEELVTQPRRRRKMGTAARAYVERDFRRDILQRQIGDAYCEFSGADRPQKHIGRRCTPDSHIRQDVK